MKVKYFILVKKALIEAHLDFYLVHFADHLNKPV